MVSDQEIPHKYVFKNDSVTTFLLLEIQGMFIFPYLVSDTHMDIRTAKFAYMSELLWFFELLTILNNQSRLI